MMESDAPFLPEYRDARMVARLRQYAQALAMDTCCRGNGPMRAHHRAKERFWGRVLPAGLPEAPWQLCVRCLAAISVHTPCEAETIEWLRDDPRLIAFFLVLALAADHPRTTGWGPPCEN